MDFYYLRWSRFTTLKLLKVVPWSVRTWMAHWWGKSCPSIENLNPTFLRRKKKSHSYTTLFV